MISDLQRLETMLADLKTLPAEEQVDEDIFSICGFPHYERVASNVLAFFLDNKREHGLGDLFIQSLLSLGEVDVEVLDLNYEVQTEVSTDKGNFMDLVVESDSYTILIENKIYASVYNDLDDYYNHCVKQKIKNGQPRTVYAFVLSLKPIPQRHKKYVFIEYDKLFNEIRSRLGEYFTRSNHKYLSLLIDFMTNIENLNRGNTMDLEFISFVREHNKEIDDINARLKKIHDDFRSIVEEVNAQIKEKLQTDKIKTWAWRKLPEFYDIAVTDIYLDNVNIAIDSRIELDGWKFIVFTRKNKNGFDLEKYLQARGLQFTPQASNKLKLDTHLDIQEKTEKVVEYIISIIVKLLDDKA